MNARKYMCSQSFNVSVLFSFGYTLALTSCLNLHHNYLFSWMWAQNNRSIYSLITIDWTWHVSVSALNNIEWLLFNNQQHSKSCYQESMYTQKSQLTGQQTSTDRNLWREYDRYCLDVFGIVFYFLQWRGFSSLEGKGEFLYSLCSAVNKHKLCISHTQSFQDL